MALPTFVVPLISGLTAIGGAAQQSMAAKRAQEEQALRMQQERQRQAGIQDEQRRAALTSLGEFTPEKQKKIQDEIVGRNLSQVAELVKKAPSAQSFRDSGDSEPEVIGRQFASEQKKGQEQASEFARALAEFGAQGQALQRGLLTAQDQAGIVDRLGADAQISAALLDQEMLNASMLADSPLGNAMLGIGQAGLAASLGGAFQGGAGKPQIAPYAPYKRPYAGANPLFKPVQGSQFIPR